MRKVVLVALVVLLFAGQAFATTDDIGQGMIDKAKRGVVNLFTGIVEVPMQVYKGYNNGLDLIENKPLSKGVGAILGLFRGFGHAAGRMGWGAIELFGFWAANHEDNDGVGIPFDAEYAWEMGEQYSIFKPTLSEGVKPIGKKLVRGFVDAFTGIVEVPGQAIKGKNEGNVWLGIGKGFWFWFSRGIYGLGNIMTCIVPNPPDNPGYPLSDELPWTPLAE